MALIAPFRAWRYNPARVSLPQVVTQPYDKITSQMQERYHAASPYNLVRIILGERLADDSPTSNPYTRAAGYFRDWREAGILLQDRQPAIYGYTQRFTVPGFSGQLTRSGFIALGRIEDYSAGIIFRHEQTLAKPKADRLELLRATRAHFGQLFMLYDDPHSKIDDALASSTSNTLEITDEYGVAHQVSQVIDPSVIESVRAKMLDRKLIIADGHHRYETALNYRNECRAVAQPAGFVSGRPFSNAAKPADSEAPSDATLQDTASAHPGVLGPVNINSLDPDRKASGFKPANSLSNAVSTRTSEASPGFEPAYDWVMMTFINMDSAGLLILPTHRVVHGLSSFSVDTFKAALTNFFRVEEADPAISAERATLLLREAGQAGTAILAVSADRAFLLDHPSSANAFDVFAGLSLRQQSLDVVQLHKAVLERVLGLSEESIREQKNITYVRDSAEALRKVRSGAANLAFLMNPVRVEQVRDIAFSGEVLPQKSTDFYPKLLSGLTIYALD